MKERKVRLTYFVNDDGAKRYTISEGIEWLNEEVKFRMVYVSDESLDTKRTGTVNHIEGNVVTTEDGEYVIIGQDMRRMCLTEIDVVEWRVKEDTKITWYDADELEEVEKAIRDGKRVKAVFIDSKGISYNSGVIEWMDVKKRVFETKSEHRYQF